MFALILAAALTGLPAAGHADLLEGHGGPVHALAGLDDARVLSASFDNSIGVWTLATGEVRWLEGHAAAAKAVIALPDGRAASAGDDFAILLWDLDTGAPAHRLTGHRGAVVDLAASPGGTRLASAGWDGRIGLWDAASGAHIRWLEGHDGAVNAVAFAGNRLISASADGTIRAWDTATGDATTTLARHGFAVNRLAVGEGWLAYGAVDGGTRVLSLADGAVLADLSLDRRPILSLALSPDGAALAVGDGEGHVMVVETADWTITHDMQVSLRGPVWALAYAGDRLLAGGIANEIAVVSPGAEEGPVLGAVQPEFLRAPAEMDNGERQFARKCSVCHTLTGDGARRAGPTLANLFGRREGAVPGYPYSQTLADGDIVWSPETLDALFAEGPAHYVPGSKMPMQRITSARDRADLIEFLKTHTAE